jgi:Protein of unknown function (DUF726)
MKLKDAPTTTWVIDAEIMDAGGMDKYGQGKVRRHTGAACCVEHGKYILRWRLLPGSRDVDIEYRYALVPPGSDLPVWLMQDKESEEVPSLSRTTSNKNSTHSMSVVLLVPGLIQPGVLHTTPGIFADQFAPSDRSGGVVMALDRLGIESYALRWESKQLSDLSRAIEDIVKRVALTAVAEQGVHIIAPALVGALSLPITVVGAVRSAVDNVWGNVLSRARSAGYMLAAELASREKGFGLRPVTLAGYSSGALMIFYALEELAKTNLAGIIHDVFLIGVPVPCDVKRWRAVREVVSGRLVNAFLPGDWYLSIMSSISGNSFSSVAGTAPVLLSDAGVENVDISRDLDLSSCDGVQVTSHSDYALHTSDILVALGLGNGEQRRPWPLHSCRTRPADADDEHMFPDTPVSSAAPSPVAAGDGEVAGEVVLFTNERPRRRVQSEPPPRSRP